MTNDRIIIEFPEPELKPLEEKDITYFRSRFVDDSAWKLLCDYYNIKVEQIPISWDPGGHHEQVTIKKKGYYPQYNRKVIREHMKAMMEQ